jgi:hypothetical protein
MLCGVLLHLVRLAGCLLAALTRPAAADTSAAAAVAAARQVGRLIIACAGNAPSVEAVAAAAFV